MTPPADEQGETVDTPVSTERLDGCVRSAQRWADMLPRFADRCQLKADWWAITAGVLAAITSLAVFPVLGESSSVTAKTLVSVVALASAVSALVPRVKGYGEQAGAARVLAAQYGSVYGRLLDLVNADTANPHTAQMVVAEFQAIKEKKDALRGLTTWSTKGREPGTPPPQVPKGAPPGGPPSGNTPPR